MSNFLGSGSGFATYSLHFVQKLIGALFERILNIYNSNLNMIPTLKEKYNSDSIRTPKNFMKYRIKINKWPKFKAPESVIICYDNRILDYIGKNYDLVKYKAFCGDFWFLKETNNKVAVFGNFGLGSPMIATRMEELIQFGIKKFISIGEAGTLQKDLKIGEIIVCNKAIRDEGVSYHYLKPSKYAYASKTIVNKITSLLQKQNISFKVGSTWTMDAIYRQTKAEIKKFQREAVLTVEMEIATIFAIAQYRKIEAGAILTISDSLANLKWNPKFHETTKSLERIFEIAKNVLLN